VDTCPGGRREWIHAEIPQYYLHHYPDDPKLGVFAGKWVVIDRDSDLVDGDPYVRKAQCIKAFVRRHDPQAAAGGPPGGKRPC
jgi:hypothetical protein